MACWLAICSFSSADSVTQERASRENLVRILRNDYLQLDEKQRAAWQEAAESLQLALDEPDQGRIRLLLPVNPGLATASAQRFAKAIEPTGKRSEIEALLIDLSRQELLQAESLEAKGELERAFRLRWRASALEGILPKTRDAARTSLANTWSPAVSLGRTAVVPKAASDHPTIPWPAGSYATVTTRHFQIASQAGADRATEFANLCEQTLAIWEQVFFPYWADQQVAAPEYASHRNEVMSVVFFRDKAAYVKTLKAIEPNIGGSTGYYNPNHRIAYFYWDGNRTPSTVVHELVHQLFFERAGRDVSLDTNQDPGFWIVEGIAMYMESMSTRSCGGATLVELGGWDAPRLQAGRYRRLHDQTWIAWDEFRGATGEQFRKGKDLPTWYSQACGLAHLWMDGDDRKRAELCRYLADLYSGKDTSNALSGVTTDDEIRTAYDTYLVRSTVPASTAQSLVSARPFFSNRRDAVLSRCPVTSEQLLQWNDAYRTGNWLDLSFTKVDDSLFATGSEKAWNMTQLNLESTAITDASMAAIASMSHLVELDLSNCDISDAGVAHLKNHKTLKTLWLTGTKVSDQALDVFRSMPQLEMLHVGETRITKAGWNGLIADRPRLKSKSTNP